MNKFINIRDGKISVTSYRPADCQATTHDDLITCAVEGTDDCLTASFDAEDLSRVLTIAEQWFEANPYGLQEIWENLDIA